MDWDHGQICLSNRVKIKRPWPSKRESEGQTRGRWNGGREGGAIEFVPCLLLPPFPHRSSDDESTIDSTSFVSYLLSCIPLTG